LSRVPYAERTVRGTGRARELFWRVRTLLRYADIVPALADVVPPNLDDLDSAAYVPGSERLGPIDLRDDAQLEWLARWEDYGDLFAALRADPRINTQQLGSNRIHNGSYPTPDAEVYAAMLAHKRPRRVIEVGAGFSTVIARRAIERAGLQCELIVIDPQPRTAVADIADRVILRRVEDAGAELEVDADTVLFIDGSHVVRSGGDVPFLFCDVVPRLPPGALVHVHDIFIPFDYPPAYQRRLYGEQYLLFALLAGGDRFRVEFATHYMVREHGDAMRARFGPAVGVDPLHFGGSLWFSVSR
jgi:methyltransferase family protein